MMEENNGIFLVGCDALVYLAEPMHKKYSATFVWGHPFSTYVSLTDFSTPLRTYEPVHILDDPPPLPQWLTYLMDGLFLIQKKQIRTFKYRIN